MAYIGKQPVVGNFQVCDAISVVNGQAAYTMQVGSANVEPENANHMLVSLNGILQKPGSSFTISGSTITFASNLATGDVIDFIILLGDTLNVGTPSDDSVGAAQTKNDLISGQTALASEPADTDEFLVSDAGTIKRIDYSLIKGSSNTPAFHATMSADSTGNTNNTFTKIPFNTETFDSDGTYDHSSNYRFTPGVAGKYFISAQVDLRDNGANEDLQQKTIAIYKNGSAHRIASFKTSSSDYIAGNAVQTISITDILSLDDNDYIEIYAKAYNKTWDCEADNSMFFGYLIGGA